jgi:hypothetical protein
MTTDEARRLIGDAVAPAHFFTGPATRLEREHVPAETIRWEVFRGRLLDPAHTRLERTFKSWNLYLANREGRSAEPLLSVKWDADAGEVHVVRAVLSYVHEGYDAGGNVILSREVRKWVRELVGTIGRGELRPELPGLLFRAVIGTSRLPLTSLEAPLPGFALGELGYFPRCRPGGGAMSSPRELIERGLSAELDWLERVKLLELLLRAAPAGEVPGLSRQFLAWNDRWLCRAGQAARLVRSLFNEVSLSPYTDFVSKALGFIEALAQDGGLSEADVVDLLGHLLRQTARHLTAYDLVVFHHAGANYPDALMLDEVLHVYRARIAASPALFLDVPADDEAARKGKRLRRRALRQAWLIRERYRGHLVPDMPTSPGENARVLPAPHSRVPDEQFLYPHRRTRRLFADDALGERAGAVFRQSVVDLRQAAELRELGAALYLDRPLGALKAPGEPDRTPLLSYEAISREVAMRRLHLLGRDETIVSRGELAALQQALQELSVPGLPLTELSPAARPGAVSLADAGKAAADFVFIRTTASSARDFFAQFDLAPLVSRFGLPGGMEGAWLILGQPEAETGEIVLTVREAGTLRRRLELSANPNDCTPCRAGTELPRQGLRVLRVWEVNGENVTEHDLRAEQLFLGPLTPAVRS